MGITPWEFLEPSLGSIARMNSDYTQQQSLGGLHRSEQMSLQATQPPAEISGYRIDTLLGQGAFGQVWLGSDLNTGRQVAIKFYLHRSGVDWSLLRREVKNLVNMSTGRYIVQVLSVGWEAEPPYYVMEYLENGSLEDLVRAQGALTIGEAVRMLREIADGLSFAHSKGVMHCDLKPANIVLDHDWRPRLADFGQSRMSDDQTPSLGTLFYMAPEQADLTATADAAWDVYALGAIAYTMLVGSPPYRSPSVIETLDTANSLPERLSRYRDAIRQNQRPKLHYRRRGIDKGLCQIVDRCLAVRPENRFRNVQQVIEAIDAWQRAKTRRPLYILGILGPIVLLLLVTFFSSRSSHVATTATLHDFQRRAIESNRFAAQLAARTLEKEIEGLYRLVETEARRKELAQLLMATSREGGAMLEQLTQDPNDESTRDRFAKLPARIQLQEYLELRLQKLVEAGQARGIAVAFNSLFVNESQGFNLGTIFADPADLTESSSLGHNFAYRTYFNGLREDGDKTKPSNSFQPIRQTHLSASFRSTSTGKWKLGVSTPVWEDENVADGSIAAPKDVAPIGVIVLTINLGDFDLLKYHEGEEQTSQFTVIVDGRAGAERGRLLQHPLIHAMDKETMRELSMPRMSVRQIEQLQESEGVADYVDPAAKFENAEKFAGTWIAAMQQVSLPHNQATRPEDSMTDLWVLVQERTSTVEVPLRQLGTRLQRETYIALGTMLSVVAVMWFFVLRLNQAFPAKAASSSGLGARNTGLSATLESDR